MAWNCIVVATNVAAQAATFSVIDTKPYVPIVTLTQDNAKLFEQLKLGFKRTINWNQYQPKDTTERPSFQGVNRLCFTIWKWGTTNKLQTILSSD